MHSGCRKRMHAGKTTIVKATVIATPVAMQDGDVAVFMNIVLTVHAN